MLKVTRQVKQPTNVSSVDMVFTQVTPSDGHTIVWTGQSLKTVVWFIIHGRKNITRSKHTYTQGDESNVNIFPKTTSTYQLALLQCINVKKLTIDDVTIID